MQWITQHVMQGQATPGKTAKTHLVCVRLLWQLVFVMGPLTQFFFFGGGVSDRDEIDDEKIGSCHFHVGLASVRKEKFIFSHMAYSAERKSSAREGSTACCPNCRPGCCVHSSFIVFIQHILLSVFTQYSLWCPRNNGLLPISKTESWDHVGVFSSVFSLSKYSEF